MATDNEVQGTTEGPFQQFEECSQECKYKDTDGRCIFETCISSNTLPPANMLWYFECIICKRVDSIEPKAMKIHICSECIKRIQKVEALPIRCKWCQAEISEPTSWMFSGLCEACLDKIHAAAFCSHCGRG
jgi:hypothetical protein